MKVVHLSTTDTGGAFKGTWRIHECLQGQNVESCVLVRSKFSSSDTVEVIDSFGKKLFSKMRNAFNLLYSKGQVVSDIYGAHLNKIPQIIDADIIFLHWVNSFVSAQTVIDLLKLNKPIVWVMHDMWVFTGGCHCDEECGKYEVGCGQCPLTNSFDANDITHRNIMKKAKVYADSNITFVALSNWELACARKSIALQNCNIIKIPNPLNLNIFCPLEREYYQKQKQQVIPHLFQKKIILFGANKAIEDKNKGFNYLVESLKYLDSQKYCLVCFGGETSKQEIKMPDNMDMISLGVIHDEHELAVWYNIADVFVAPSMQESFCYTVCEALACGTPVAAFGVGGIVDQVEHMRNGYLAKIRDAYDLAIGIQFCVENRGKLTRRARNGVVDKNNYNEIGKRYVELCNNLLKKD